MENKEVYLALHNCGYRFLGKTNEVYTYGKPIGYGILRADFYPNDMKIDMLLMVKGNIEDDKLPNLVWNSSLHKISCEHDDLYLNCVQTIKDCEAEIFFKSPVAWGQNRLVRYDFKENSIFNL
mgnify:CR=1 FL=1